MKQSSVSKLNQTQVQQEIAKCIEQTANNPPSAEVYLNLGQLNTLQKQWQQAKNSY
ncbi:MAG: hypothetical protein ACFCAD_01665 [Pleurocapsa sp.]